jgi:FkbM family methyltransferase
MVPRPLFFKNRTPTGCPRQPNDSTHCSTGVCPGRGHERMNGSHITSGESVLGQIFAAQRNGVYVDIGAAHPTVTSLTWPLYKAGWRGVNVEPVRSRFQLFVEQRAEDLNLHLSVASRAGTMEFRDPPPHRQQDADESVKPYLVETVTGDTVLARAERPVDLLIVHADGAEEDVLRSINFGRHAPKVVVVDAMRPVPPPTRIPWATEGHDRWEPYLVQSGYHLVGYDGIDRFYLRDDLSADRVISMHNRSPYGRGGPHLRRLLLHEADALRHAHQRELRELQRAHQVRLDQLTHVLIAKERVIVEQGRALSAYRAAHYPLSAILPVLRRVAAWRRRCREILRPRLGRLRQYRAQGLDLAASSSGHFAARESSPHLPGHAKLRPGSFHRSDASKRSGSVLSKA